MSYDINHDSINQLLQAGFVYLADGRNRRVYRRKSIVAKVPIRWDGVYDNEHEAKRYKQFRKGGFIPYARCRMWKYGILIMEYVQHVGWSKKNPSWTNYVDCGQVGRDKQGRLVAYDYGRF